MSVDNAGGPREKAFGDSLAFGPGLVRLLGGFGPNDLIVHTVVGATYGYSLLWVLPVAFALNYAIAEASARYVLATGESIVEGYGRLGKPVVLALAGAIFIRRHLYNLMMVLLLGASAQLLVPLPAGKSSIVWSTTSVGLAFWLMYRGRYGGVEKACRVFLPVLGGSFLVVAFLADPEPREVFRGLLIPSFPPESATWSLILLLTTIAGNTLGSINNLKYPAYVFEKGWRSPGELRKQRVDLLLSVLGHLLLAVLIQVTAAASLQGIGAAIHDIEDMASVLAGPLGESGRIVLAAGIWTSAFATYLGSNTGYALIVGDVYERYLRRPGDRRPRDLVRDQAYRAVLVFFCVSPLYVLFTDWEPVWLSIIATAMFVLLTPVVAAGLLLLTSNRTLMKDHTSGPWSKFAISLALLISAWLSYKNAVELIGDLV